MSALHPSPSETKETFNPPRVGVEVAAALLIKMLTLSFEHVAGVTVPPD